MKLANLSELEINLVILILLNVIECALSVLGVTGLNAALLPVGVSAEESALLFNPPLVMKFVLNCTKLIDATMNLLQITALGPLGVTGVLALLVARRPQVFQPALKSAT
jgi:hypothetical protein